MKYFFLVPLLLLLTACKTTTGLIEHTSNRGSKITIIQPEDAETPATLDAIEDSIIFEHKTGDMITFFFTPFNFNDTTISLLDRIEYKPVTGASSNLLTSVISAVTGNPREDKTKAITAMMENTKYIQYVGIGLTVLGVIMVVIFKVKIQALFLSALGVGMIILQSQLANPVFAWLVPLAIIILPLFWLYHFYRARKTVISTATAIELFIKENPEEGEKLKKLYLSRKMDKMEKQYIKEIKPEIKE